jgi:hypothetical protein
MRVPPVAVPAEPAPVVEPAIDPDGKGFVVVDGGVAVDEVPLQQVLPVRDALWPKSVLTWLILSVIFLVLSVQSVSPTRRWRLRRGKRSAADVPAGPLWGPTVEAASIAAPSVEDVPSVDEPNAEERA